MLQPYQRMARTSVQYGARGFIRTEDLVFYEGQTPKVWIPYIGAEHLMKDHTNKEDRDAVSGWEDEGGVGPSEVGGQPDIARAAGDKRGSDREQLDALTGKPSLICLPAMSRGKSPVRPNPTDQDAALSECDSHAYPCDLAQAVHRRCPEVLTGTGIHLTLPEPAQLEEALSVCYQASLLREEGRPVTFRVALAGPEVYPPAEGPPAGLHRLVFSDSRPFDQHELRRLAPAAVFSRTLIGAIIDRDSGGPRIWGLIHSGAHWLQSVRGGRETQQAIPACVDHRGRGTWSDARERGYDYDLPS